MTHGASYTQRAIGAVLGSAAGDALGAPFEFGPAGRYSERFPAPVLGGVGEMTGGGSFGWAPGEFTDDTQMAIVQAESILEHGGVDGADLFERFRVWATGAPDVGIQTAAALHSGLPWDRAAIAHYERTPRGGAGNGSLMRSTPTAVRYASASVDETVQVARDTAIITHGDPAAGWGTALFHVTVRAALNGDDALAALEEQLDQLPPDQDRYRRMLAPDWTPATMEVPNGSVWGCLAQAVWAVRSTTAFADAVVSAIDLGGDTDTVAAVTGGLAGAVYGVQAIPSRWVTYLHGHVTTSGGRRRYDAVHLNELALRLIDKEPQEIAPLGDGIGPTEIAPGVFAANLRAAAHTPTDHAVISLCRTNRTLDDHPVRR
jgi:ADP-ribosyl-[dinitrogen reductase] hydrolase